MSIKTYIYIIGNSETDLWGLSGHERLQRMINNSKQPITIVNDPETIPGQASALLLYASYLYDSRVLASLLDMQKPMVLYSSKNIPVAVRTVGNRVHGVLSGLQHNDSRTFSTLQRFTVEDVSLGFQQNLKKKDVPYVLPINKGNRKLLESALFAGSYKGVTDLVTKWLWPLPAFWATKLCVRYGWKPNQVTLMSLLLAILTGIAFWFGHYGIGLIMGWAMTFLDTVDGKLARVTITSSRLGDVLDHGLDLIHPPLWYWAWGIGLATTMTPITDITFLLWVMLFGYIGGRLCEGVFQLWLAPFDIFIWRQLDSFNRLITARRNPNLILLTFGWMIDRPDIGFLLMIAWHLISTFILIARLIAAIRTRIKEGPLKSWLADIDPGRDRNILAVKIFTRAPIRD